MSIDICNKDLHITDNICQCHSNLLLISTTIQFCIKNLYNVVPIFLMCNALLAKMSVLNVFVVLSLHYCLYYVYVPEYYQLALF